MPEKIAFLLEDSYNKFIEIGNIIILYQRNGGTGMEKEEYIVNGIKFSDREQAEEAKKEWEGIQYIKNKNDLSNPELLLKLYNKLVERNLFHTIIGEQFIEELEKSLLSNSKINPAEVKKRPEKLNQQETEKKKKETELKSKDENKNVQIQNVDSKKINKTNKKENSYKYKFYNSLILNIVFLLAIIAIIYITVTSRQENSAHYNTQWINEHVAWEQELKERESIVTEKEKELGIIP